MSLRTTDGVFEKTYDKRIIVLEANNRNQTLDPRSINFSIKLASPLRDVVAITPIEVKLDGYDITNLGTVLLDVNGYQHTIVDSFLADNADSTQSATGLLPLTMTTTGCSFKYDQCPTNLGIDPYTYVFDPVESTIRRFQVRLLNPNGTQYDYTEGTENDFNLMVKLVVYMKREKYSRI